MGRFTFKGLLALLLLALVALAGPMQASAGLAPGRATSPGWVATDPASTATLWGLYTTDRPIPDNGWNIRASSKYPGLNRFEVRQGDEWPGDIGHGAGKNRAEMVDPRSAPYAVDVWQADSLYLAALPAGGVTPGQWHAIDDPGDVATSPVFWRQVSSTGVLTYKYSGAAESPVVDPVEVTLATMPFQAGHWYHFVHHLVFAKGTATGRAEVWVSMDNGAATKLVDASNILMGYNQANPPYWKWGLYRSLNAQTLVGYYQLRSAKTYQTLAPLIGVPPVLPSLLEDPPPVAANDDWPPLALFG